MDNGRTISNLSRFQFCSYANDVATTHVVYSYYTAVVVPFVLWVWPRNQSQSTHIYISHTKTPKLLRPIKDFGGRIITTINSTIAVQAQKKTLSHGPKTPLVACVFYLFLICTCFWLNLNMYTCFWQLTQKNKQHQSTFCCDHCCSVRSDYGVRQSI